MVFQTSMLPCVLGADIAEVMLDFIDWLTHQEFGRRCVVSIRTLICPQVNFMNTMGRKLLWKDRRPSPGDVFCPCRVPSVHRWNRLRYVGWWEQGVRLEGDHEMEQAQTSEPGAVYRFMLTFQDSQWFSFYSFWEAIVIKEVGKTFHCLQTRD